MGLCNTVMQGKFRIKPYALMSKGIRASDQSSGMSGTSLSVCALLECRTPLALSFPTRVSTPSIPIQRLKSGQAVREFVLFGCSSQLMRE